MEEAERACGLPQHRDDPALQGFAAYLKKHIPEETGHDVWVLNDGEAMGIDRNEILARLPTEGVTQVVGVQYYWIKHYNPIALIGHIATLEGNPPTTEFVEQVAERSGLSLDCFSSLLYHARIDPQHKKDLDDLLDSLPLNEEHIALIGLSSLRTIGLMTQIIEKIVQPTDSH